MKCQTGALSNLDPHNQAKIMIIPKSVFLFRLNGTPESEFPSSEVPKFPELQVPGFSNRLDLDLP